ncbi:MauE/DoxX family redox-associated membrane protein [Streptomyces sp. NBC_01198]|uniref:MauE/DoxX family redox-associated membrane protein n=1 Tax=Streptomyces sp. NBC_01198 TaxID=2903769 RepID=UPI002E0EE795|nr:hypothetical protein OG702_15355 [Streptomyces sp. NBC_01198]
MIPLVSNLAPPVCALLLALTGAAKLFGRQTARLAANTVLVRVLNDGRRATRALRVLGALELALAAALVSSPAALLPGIATALLGAGFTGYLAYAKATAPESSCGCGARAEGPIGLRSFTRAGLVVAGGAAAAGGDAAWWSEVSRRPGGSALVLAAAAVLLAGLTADLDRVWRVPLGKARIRVFGNPLPSVAGERVPVAATVQLLENSLAWQTAMPVVRSALLDHWDDEGWRVLRYAGSYRDARGTHPVSVLFALDLTLTVDTAPNPAVRVSMIDEETEEVVPSAVLTPVPRRTVLPLAT